MTPMLLNQKYLIKRPEAPVPSLKFFTAYARPLPLESIVNPHKMETHAVPVSKKKSISQSSCSNLYFALYPRKK